MQPVFSDPAVVDRIDEFKLVVGISDEDGVPVAKTAAKRAPASSGGSAAAKKKAKASDDNVDEGGGASEYTKMSLVELKEACREKGLKVGGTKADLIARLQE